MDLNQKGLMSLKLEEGIGVWNAAVCHRLVWYVTFICEMCFVMIEFVVVFCCTGTGSRQCQRTLVVSSICKSEWERSCICERFFSAQQARSAGQSVVEFAKVFGIAAKLEDVRKEKCFHSFFFFWKKNAPSLALGNNMLSSLPKPIGELTNLRGYFSLIVLLLFSSFLFSLGLNNNQLSRLPSSMSSMSSLEL